METKEDLSSKTDFILMLSEWIKDYCIHMGDELARNKKTVDSGYTRHHIRQWSESTLGFLAHSTLLPCPSCNEHIPLRLDLGLINEIIISLLSDGSEKKRDDINIIKDMITETADVHQVSCKGHNNKCPFSNKGYIPLSSLLSFKDHVEQSQTA